VPGRTAARRAMSCVASVTALIASIVAARWPSDVAMMIPFNARIRLDKACRAAITMWAASTPKKSRSAARVSLAAETVGAQGEVARPSGGVPGQSRGLPGHSRSRQRSGRRSLPAAFADRCGVAPRHAWRAARKPRHRAPARSSWSRSMTSHATPSAASAAPALTTSVKIAPDPSSVTFGAPSP
jgi:hypothetical protein